MDVTPKYLSVINITKIPYFQGVPELIVGVAGAPVDYNGKALSLFCIMANYIKQTLIKIYHVVEEF